MKIVKRLLLVIVIFIVIAIVISIFLPSKLHVENKILIDADVKQVFNQVNDLKNWKNWSPWVLKDSSVYIDNANYSNPSYGDGAYFQWNSEVDEVGSGKLMIQTSVKNKNIDYSVDFGMGDAIGKIDLNTIESGVEVVWSFDMEFGFNPVSKFFGLFMEKYIAQDYELGLERLKVYAENLPKINSVKVEKVVIDKTWVLSIRDTINQMEMTNIHGKMYGQISQFMEENEIDMADSPIVIYHFWSDSIIDIEAGIPIQDSLPIIHSSIKVSKLNAGNVVTAVHYGPYERLVETYDGINEWMRKNKVTVIGPPWEQYITDPATEPDPDKWQTAVHFQVLE